MRKRQRKQRVHSDTKRMDALQYIKLHKQERGKTMQIILTLSKDEVNKLCSVAEIRDEHDVKKCLHDMINDIKGD